MSTLREIEQAVESLPRKQQQTLLRHLTERLSAGPSCYELARDLFEKPGRIGASGRRDLSTNKKHLAEFGRKRAAK